MMVLHRFVGTLHVTSRRCCRFSYDSSVRGRKGVPPCCGSVAGRTMERPTKTAGAKEMGGMKTVQFIIKPVEPSVRSSTGWHSLVYLSCAYTQSRKRKNIKDTQKMSLCVEAKAGCVTGGKMLSSKTKWVTTGTAPIPLPICEDFCEAVIRLTPVPCVHRVPPHPPTSSPPISALP